MVAATLAALEALSAFLAAAAVKLASCGAALPPCRPRVGFAEPGAFLEGKRLLPPEEAFALSGGRKLLSRGSLSSIAPNLAVTSLPTRSKMLRVSTFSRSEKFGAASWTAEGEGPCCLFRPLEAVAAEGGRGVAGAGEGWGEDLAASSGALIPPHISSISAWREARLFLNLAFFLSSALALSARLNLFKSRANEHTDSASFRALIEVPFSLFDLRATFSTKAASSRS